MMWTPCRPPLAPHIDTKPNVHNYISKLILHQPQVLCAPPLTVTVFVCHHHYQHLCSSFHINHLSNGLRLRSVRHRLGGGGSLLPLLLRPRTAASFFSFVSSLSTQGGHRHHQFCSEMKRIKAESGLHQRTCDSGDH